MSNGIVAHNSVNLKEAVQGLYSPGQYKVVGLTGQAGAGKTWTSKMVEAACEERNIDYVRVSLDWFFILSSKDRKKWLAEAEHDPLEYARRKDQLTWWDFDRAATCLLDLKAGKTVELKGVYNRADGGELTKDVTLLPQKRGGIVLIEGVAIVDLPIDLLVYIAASLPTRFPRLYNRDKARRTGIEAIERLLLTETFEVGYFNTDRWSKIHLIIDSEANGGGRVIPKLARDDFIGV